MTIVFPWLRAGIAVPMMFVLAAICHHLVRPGGCFWIIMFAVWMRGRADAA